jgi:hypothetical protein
VVVAVNDEIAAVLAGDRSELASSSTAERVAGILRTRIMEGLFPPGSRLSEEVLGRALGCRGTPCGRRSVFCATSGSPSTR